MSNDPRLIGTALDEDGDAIDVYVYADGVIEIEETLDLPCRAGEKVYTQLTVAEAAVLSRLLLAAGDVAEA